MLNYSLLWIVFKSWKWKNELLSVLLNANACLGYVIRLVQWEKNLILLSFGLLKFIQNRTVWEADIKILPNLKSKGSFWAILESTY